MEQFYIRKAALFGGKLCVVSLGGFGLWLLCGVAEYPALWWLYALTAALCFVLAALMAALVSLSEDDLKRDMDDYRRVPVRKIERRASPAALHRPQRPRHGRPGGRRRLDLRAVCGQAKIKRPHPMDWIGQGQKVSSWKRSPSL